MPPIPEAVEANRATYWYPILADTNLPVPDAKLVEIEPGFKKHLQAYEGTIGEEEDLPGLDHLIDAVEDYGTPVFIRSDLSSAKHHGIEGIKAETLDDVSTVASWIIEHHGMDFLGANPTHWMIRPWIDMDAWFTKEGYFGKPGLPIPPEYRIFATREGKHLCTHFYWPEEEIEKRGPEGAVQMLDEMQNRTEDDLSLLELKAEAAAEYLGKVPAWSIDFALTEDGTWTLIDVADSRTSWHPEDCPHHEEIRNP